MTQSIKALKWSSSVVFRLKQIRCWLEAKALLKHHRSALTVGVASFACKISTPLNYTLFMATITSVSVLNALLMHFNHILITAIKLDSSISLHYNFKLV